MVPVLSELSNYLLSFVVAYKEKIYNEQFFRQAKLFMHNPNLILYHIFQKVIASSVGIEHQKFQKQSFFTGYYEYTALD